jgi:Flp pilus assembly protein TadG
MSLTKLPEGRTGARRRKQRGQSLVEFAISSTVLLLLAMGLIDLSRAFYFSVALQGAAREGARHAAWFNTAQRANLYLQDSEIRDTVRQALAGAGFTTTQVTFKAQSGCLTPTDGNTQNDKPYPQAAYPTTPQTVYVYACYTNPSGISSGTNLTAPTDNSWRLGDVNVAVLMNFQLITPFIQSFFGQTINLAYNEHFTIQGKP